MDNKVNFIAEVSSNHSKDLNRSLKFVDTASEIGCSSVKFQLFKINELFAPEILNKSKEISSRKNWELPLDFLEPLSKRCEEKKIKFSCTPFYLKAVGELENYVDFYKIASYELLWDELLIECAISKKPIILSTGMATIDEISHAVKVLKNAGCEDLSLMHCVSCYPSPYKESNLSSIKTLRDTFNCEVGWSDHSYNPGVLYRSINRWGARVIEFHIDLEGEGEEYSSGHCWLPNQISEVIKNINHGFESDGDGIKKPSKSEMNERDWRADPSDGLRPLIKIRKNY